MQSRHLAAAIAWALLGTAGAARANSTPDYRVTKTVPLGAPDRWDYVVFDPASQRVFIAHADRVTVTDKDGAVIGIIAGLSSATHGIGISSGNGRGYTDDSTAGTAGAFDLATLKPGKTIKAAEDADAIAVDPKTGHVYVINGDTGTITVIDPKADAAIGTIEVGGKLEYAVADGAGKLFVNGAGKREIIRIDTATDHVDARWPVPDCESPHGLALDPATHRLFTSCVNRVLVVVATDDGRQVAKLPIGKGTDAAAFDPRRKLIFSSNGVDGTLSIIRERDADHFEAAGTIKTAVTARTMALDPATGRLYLVAADAEPVAPGGGRPKIMPGTVKLLILDPAS